MRVSTCATGKEIWDRLCITYKETSEVKYFRLNILLHDYELFCMKPSETISDIYTRFTQIVTSLHPLDREISNSKKVNKILSITNNTLAYHFPGSVVSQCYFAFSYGLQ